MFEDEGAEFVAFRLRLQLYLRHYRVESLASAVRKVVAQVNIGRHSLSVITDHNALDGLGPAEHAGHLLGSHNSVDLRPTTTVGGRGGRGRCDGLARGSGSSVQTVSFGEHDDDDKVG